MPPSFNAPIASHACDACRRRKVKCDGSRPCVTCNISGNICQYAIPHKKRGPKTNSKRSTKPHRQTADGQCVQVVGRTNLSAGQPRRMQRFPVQPGAELYNVESLKSPTSSQSPISQWSLEESLVSSNCVNIRGDSSSVRSVATPSSARVHAVWYELLRHLRSNLPPSVSAADAVDRCIDLYVHYAFPTAPIIHEPALRESNAAFFGISTTSTTSPMLLFNAGDEHQYNHNTKSFVLIAGLCAAVASVMPNSLLPYRHVLIEPCLRASRETLLLYEDHDLEHPDSTSLAVRLFHSTALQHITGRTGAAWHVFSQAALLALRLRLYDEESVKRNDPVEAELLRRIFWHLYTSDKAAACMGNRVSIMHETLFDGGGLTLKQHGEFPTPLLDQSRRLNEYQNQTPFEFEHNLLTGYHLVRSFWSSAAALIITMKSTTEKRFELRSGIAGDVTKAGLMQAYLDFSSMIDFLPSSSKSPTTVETASPSEASSWYEVTSLEVQRCNTLVVYHCLRLVILQTAIDSGVTDVLGLNDQPLSLAMKKLEIMRDFIHVLETSSFILLQAQGEPMVERIRKVGSILLEVLQNIEHETIRTRSRAYFSRLLDILTKLDSKASDELSELHNNI